MKEEKKNVGKDVEIDLEKDGGKICGGMVAAGQVAVMEGGPIGALVSENISDGVLVGASGNLYKDGIKMPNGKWKVDDADSTRAFAKGSDKPIEEFEDIIAIVR